MSSIREDLLPQPGDVIADHYEIESLLGHGGMGAVFAAKHTRTGRAVAIKWMLPHAAASTEAVARFIAEAKATARIEHPNVVHIYDFGEASGSPFLVMERLRGRSLREHLDLVGRLSPVEAIHLLVPAMRGVAEAHREGIIHRDIKPDNIFLCEGKDGSAREAKVVDFGISKLFDGDPNSNLTGTGMMMGTPAYMSPEQLNAPRDADPRFDVYAFGVVFYEAVTGRQPYRADGIFQLVAQIMEAEVIRPSQLHPELSVELDAVILRAMHREQHQRFASMQEMIEHFDALRGRPDVAVPAPSTGPMQATAQPWPATQVATPPPGFTPAQQPQVPVSYATTPPGTNQTAVLTPMGTHAGYGSGVSHSLPQGMGPAGTPHTPYGTMATPKRASGIKITLIGGLALLLGGLSAAGIAFVLAGRGGSEIAEPSNLGDAPDLPAPALDVPPGVEPPEIAAGVESPSPTASESTAVNMAETPGEALGAEAAEAEAAETETETEVAGTEAPSETVPAPRVRHARRPSPAPRPMPLRPVVRPMPPAPGTRPPVVRRPPANSERGANGAMIIE